MVMETNFPVEPGGGPPSLGGTQCPDGSMPDSTGMCPGGGIAQTALPPVTDTYSNCPPGQSWDIATGMCRQGTKDTMNCTWGMGPDGNCLPYPVDGQYPAETDTLPDAGQCGPGMIWDYFTSACKPDPNQPPTNQPPTTDTLPDAGQCPQGQIWDYFTSTCKQAPNVGSGPGSHDTVLPDVSPYDVSQSRDWMNIFDYGGENANVNAINPQARDMDYGQINNFADAAWQNSMRHLQPAMDLQDDRFAQELINKGIDPNSEAGQKAFRQKQMGQNDMLSKSAFDAMGFGTDIQNQMFGQDAVRSQLANAMLQSQMGLSQRGHEFDTTAEMQANEQAFMQMMGLEGLNYRDYLTMVDQGRYQDSLALALAGLAPAPTFNTSNTGLSQYPGLQYANETNYFQDLYGG